MTPCAAETHFLENAGGPRLAETVWHAGADARGVVALVHGYAEHAGRYAALAERLNARGFALRAIDLRGQGKAEGRRAFVRSFDVYVDEARRFVQHVRRQSPGLPLFLMGHSMGGVVAALLAESQTAGLQGVVLSAPAVQIPSSIHPLLQKVSPLLSLLLPTLPTIRPDISAISRDPQVVAAFKADPLVFHGRMPARMGSELLRAGRRALRAGDQIRLPLLMLHGTSDGLADIEGSRQLHERSGSPDKTLKEYAGLYHEVLNEPEREQVMADLIAWLEERLPRIQAG